VELVADDSVNVIYEAAFAAEGYSTRADVIVCNHYCLLLCVFRCVFGYKESHKRLFPGQCLLLLFLKIKKVLM